MSGYRPVHEVTFDWNLEIFRLWFPESFAGAARLDVPGLSPCELIAVLVGTIVGTCDLRAEAEKPGADLSASPHPVL